MLQGSKNFAEKSNGVYLTRMFGRCRTEGFLVDFRKVRQILESYLKTYFRNFPAAFAYEFVSRLKTPLYEPFLWRKIAVLAEIAFEGRQTAPGIVCHFFERKFIAIVLFHKFHDVDLPWIYEIEKRCVEVNVGIQNGIYALGHFEFQDFVGRRGVGVEVWNHRLEETADVYAVRRKDVEAGFVALRIRRYIAAVQSMIELSQKLPREF